MPTTEEAMGKIIQQKALMKVQYTALGSVLVKCPYCLVLLHIENLVDVTKFVDGDGKRDVKTECSKGHTLKFRTIDAWRAERIKAGVHKPL